MRLSSTLLFNVSNAAWLRALQARVVRQLKVEAHLELRLRHLKRAVLLSWLRYAQVSRAGQERALHCSCAVC